MTNAADLPSKKKVSLYIGMYQLNADIFPNTLTYTYLDGGAFSSEHNYDSGWSSQGYPACFAWKVSTSKITPIECDTQRAYICRKDPPSM